MLRQPGPGSRDDRHGCWTPIGASLRIQRQGVCCMHAEALATYINDHLAGSVAALELLDDLIARPVEPDEPEFFIRLRDGITEDQESLRGLLRDLGKGESAIRKAAGWLTEKVATLKLRWDDPGNG